MEPPQEDLGPTWSSQYRKRSLGSSRSQRGVATTGRIVILLAAVAAVFVLHQSNRVIAYLQSVLVVPPPYDFLGEIYDGASPKKKADSAGPDFDLAKRESLGFFTDVPSHHWNLLKKKVKDMSPNFNTWCLPAGKVNDNRQKQPGFFYQNHYEPDFVCQHERRIGKLGDGGKWICDPHRIAEQEDCLVYSVGSNNDFSFETFVLKDIGQHCEIHTFDFGNYVQGAKNVGYRLHNGLNKTAVTYHQVGMGIDDPPKYKSLQTIANELGHNGRTIDLFKIDCEGCEWTTANHWFEANVTLRQILVELHKSDVVKTPRFFDLMYENGYVIFHKEANIAYSGPKDIAIEYALLKLAPEFHAGYDRPKGAVEEEVK